MPGGDSSSSPEAPLVTRREDWQSRQARLLLATGCSGVLSDLRGSDPSQQQRSSIAPCRSPAQHQPGGPCAHAGSVPRGEAVQLPPARPRKQPCTEGPAELQQPSPEHGLTTALPHGPRDLLRCPRAFKAHFVAAARGTKSSLKEGKVKPNPAWAWGRQTIPLLIFPLALISIQREGTGGTLHTPKTMFAVEADPLCWAREGSCPGRAPMGSSDTAVTTISPHAAD